MLAQSWKGLLFAQLQLLNKFHFFAQQQHHQAHYFFIYALFDGDSRIALESHCGNVLERFDGGRIDKVEEAHEVHLFLVAVQTKQNFDLIIALDDPIFFQYLQDVPAGDETLSSGDVVEQCQWMEVGTGGNGLTVGLQHVLLLLKESKVAAYVVEDLTLLELSCLLGQALSVHNDYIIIILMEGVGDNPTQKMVVIINADDFGCDADIDRGIVQLIRNRCINSTSVLINGSDVVNGAKLINEMLKEMPQLERELSVGLHFNITEGKPLTKSILESKLAANGEFVGKPKIFEITQQSQSFQSYQVEEQLAGQVQRFIDLFGRKPSHIDGHNHAHIIPAIAQVVAKAMYKLGIKKTRIPLQRLQEITLPINHLFLKFSESSKQIYLKYGIISAAEFVGLQNFGNLSADLLRKAVKSQAERNGSVEMMCHPGYSATEGNPWVTSKDRLKQMKQLSNQFEQFKGLGNYHDLKESNSNFAKN